MPGEILGRFRLEARVSSGGMGEIHRARDLETGEVVAIKVLREASADHVARFEREAQALARLTHPGIVRYVAHDTSPQGEPFLVMEWLSGEDLGRVLSRRRLTPAETVRLGMRVAAALGAAHAAGIVHRDLKPSNIFLPNGDLDDPRLLDFGIACLAGDTRITNTGIVLGTPFYMAPEQARSHGEVTPAADVFSLGCVLFECLTGVPPFRAAHVIAVLAKLVFEDAPRAIDLCPEVPAWLDALLAQMLSKKPAERPQDGAAAHAALAAQRTVEAPPMSMRGPALTGDERRFLGAVLLGRPSETSAHAAPAGTLTSFSTAGLDAVAARFGGHLELFADGTAVVILDKPSIPTDIAARAARCALSAQESAPGCPIAITAGWGTLSHGLPVGEALERAAQLLRERGTSDAEGGPIVLDEVTAGLLTGRFDVADLARGTFVLNGERSAGEALRPLLGKPTPCVGREHELMLLDQTFLTCVDEPAARVVLVSGPAGIGKSRLLHASVERRRRAAEPVAIFVGRGDALRAGSTYGLLADLLRGAAGLKGGEPLEVRREQLAARVARNVPERELRRVTEFLGEIAGIPFPDEDSVPLRAARQDPELFGEQAPRALRDFLRAECAAHPVLLVLEDVHWGDRASVTAIDAALRELADLPLLVLASARPEIDELFPRLWAERGRQDLHLGHLSPKASTRLAREALGDADRTLIDRLVAQSEGHPFFLEELIRTVAVGREGTLPGTVVAMVQARLERLDPSTRRALRAASILGEVFWSGAVARLLGDDETGSSTRAAFAQLVAEEVCVQHRESRFPGEKELAFRHALLREGAYALLTAEDRALGHRLVGEWLEAAGEADPLVLAEHFERGGQPCRAAALHLRGAERARARKDDLDAERCYGRAADLLPELPIEALRGRGLSRFRLGRYPEALADLRAARAQAVAEGDAVMEVELLLDEATALDWMSDYRTAAERVFEAEARGVREASPLLGARLLLGVGRSLHRADREEEAARALSRAAEIASGLGDEGNETHVIALLLLGFILPGLGRIEEAGEALDEVIRRCEERADLLHLGAALSNRALVRAYRGDRSGMIGDLERTIVLGRELGQPALELVGQFNLAEYLYLMADLDGAEPCVQAAAEVARRGNGGAPLPVLELLRARMHLYRGDEAAARALAAGIREEQGKGAALSPSEDVLCTMVELGAGEVDEAAWDALEERSRGCSVGQERIEVLEARALWSLRRGRIEDARRGLEKALAEAARVPNVMGGRLRRSLAGLASPAGGLPSLDVCAAPAA
ncbi:serine/threonine-protein kinase [Polyangium aurulentum]|uniref:serine/threonine-protein kinase n=1 Tax=Polyangium aurulentum TaxID=2567896 RepID=UPI001F184052|nr:serine/threonine-protein kinase [Polyangium aurulentum]